MRRLVHTRTVRFECFERPDGLWDLDATLLDVKTDPLHIAGERTVPAGEPIHEMGLRLTVDDDLRIRHAGGWIRHMPHAECEQVPASLSRLEGLHIARGWRRHVQAALGGDQGCLHMREVLFSLGTAAIQAIHPALALRSGRKAGHRVAIVPASAQVGACLAWSPASPVPKRFNDALAALQAATAEPPPTGN